MTRFIAIEPVSSEDDPQDTTVVFPVVCASANRLVFKLAQRGHEAECVKLYRCEPLTAEEETALWADHEARQIVCKHYLPMLGHPDYDPEVACVNCMAEEARLQRADYEYDRAKDR